MTGFFFHMTYHPRNRKLLIQLLNQISPELLELPPGTFAGGKDQDDGLVKCKVLAAAPDATQAKPGDVIVLFPDSNIFGVNDKEKIGLVDETRVALVCEA